jgi:membrane-associated phospholipid phosphatase
MPRRDRLRWALAAAASVGAFVGVGLVTTRTGWGAALDGAVDSWVLNELPEAVRLPLSEAARPLVIVVLTPAVVGLALLALARRAWRRAVAGVLVPGAATVAALGLPVHEVLGTGGDAFPSHHATAGLGLLVGLAVVWPRRVTRGGLVAVGAAGFLVALGNVSYHAHQPRDVAGSALLVAAVAAGTFALLGGDSPNRATAVDPASRPTGEPARRS